VTEKLEFDKHRRCNPGRKIGKKERVVLLGEKWYFSDQEVSPQIAKKKVYILVCFS
jgi:hypothetical protein